MKIFNKNHFEKFNRSRLFVLALSIVGMATLVALSFWITRSDTPFLQFSFSSNSQINKLITYQILTLVAVLLIGCFTIRLMPTNFRKYFRIGNMRASATPNKVLGISKKNTWLSIGITFAIIISVVTAVVVLLPAVKNSGFSLSLSLFSLAIVLAMSNAFVEEYISRFQVVVALDGIVSPKYIALISGVIFGVPHFIGTPGGLIGVILAGFLGWLLVKSVIETRGLGWALLIHFLQDVLIFTAILGII